MQLRYGMNPHLPASVTPVRPGEWPLDVVNGAPSYLNLLDALAGWRLVAEAADLFGRPAAASIKHLSPAGAALDGPVDEVAASTSAVDVAELSPVARAYLRARDTDPQSSYGDVVAVSAPVDVTLARLLRRKVSDAIIAPAYEQGAVDILAAKKGGRFLVLRMDPAYEPPEEEVREVHGLRLVQPADKLRLTAELVRVDTTGQSLPAHAVEDLLLGQVVLRHTQSNSVVYVRAGATLGVGAGQQSRIACTRIAGAKADAWWERRHQRPYDVAFGSDAMVNFRDNVDEAARHGVRWFAEPGGSIRDDEVARACHEHGISLVRTGVRLFRH
ncbi:phosphoribosylaminoimidazolecarboxamide formyltransferase / IMP cyclohydrolase [Actinopolymorpha cephalotaxi]|uniref:Phosphoribosylaminoimidazolecarboxamide formyltransferase / IMP cyclohydrolase n=2 Tax=Actinopolymorpha TaxID=117156 RepID=A0A1I2UVL3_9ACTN|nr:5-aminoimidazole-4-carboxamide ribonucleotide transformylase [Actinopolymorpha cephalotaxi]NYH86679.1 phosphoribosylaminoimidazolecarboxamide formyltransferase/IMP cyclohydrolase [Actinopolymorpha cephalotaxi]SFG78966.1 phosphoribosylaminoimidazolecarboxamide formyltransferase / IMP cyclohydrolase [Actinopolymorpha cephalotaxi]